MASDQLSMFEESPAPIVRVAKPSSFNLTRTINAANQTVFDHWLIPVFVGTWMVGPQVQKEKVINLENRVRRGGEFCYTVNRAGIDIEYTGRYLKLDIPSKLVFSWMDSRYPDCESQVTVEFQPADNRTRLKLTVKLAAELYDQQDTVKKEWTSRCNALATKFQFKK